MAVKQLPKDPSTAIFILIQGFKGLTVVDIEARESGGDSTSGTIILKEGATKFDILDIFHWGFHQDRTRMELAKVCAHRANAGFWVMKRNE